MDFSSIIVAAITAVCGLIGVIVSNVASNRKMAAEHQKANAKIIQQNKDASDLFIYRVEQLEKKQDKYNHLVERMFTVEGKVDALEKELHSDLK